MSLRTWLTEKKEYDLAELAEQYEGCKLMFRKGTEGLEVSVYAPFNWTFENVLVGETFMVDGSEFVKIHPIKGYNTVCIDHDASPLDQSKLPVCLYYTDNNKKVRLVSRK